MTNTLLDDLRQAKNWGNLLAEKPERSKNSRLSTSQIRKFLSQVNKFRQKAEVCTDAEWESYLSQVYMLQPRFAYQIAKDDRLRRDEVIKEFKKDVLSRLGKINSRQAFVQFSNYMEAVVAYHKEAGGND